MSVINRMLKDLEGRGARSPEEGVPAPAPGQNPKRRRPLWSYGAPVALALALVAVAAALIHQRWPAVVALWSSAAPTGATVAEETPTEPGAEDTTTSEPALASLAFALSDGAVELRLATSAAPASPPAYERDGRSVRLRLPLSGAPGTPLPAPPAEQDLVRELRLETTGRRPTLHLRVAADARIDVASDASGYVVTARAAAAKTASAKATAPAEGDATGGTDERDAAEAGAGADTQGDGSSGDNEGQAADRATAEAVRPSGRDDTAETASASATNGAEVSGASGPDGEEGSSASQSDGAAQATGDASAGGESADGGSGSGAAADGDAIVRESGESDASVRAQRRYRSARQALGNGDLAQARTQLRAALEADPELHAARDLLVTLLRRADASDTAREVLATGLELAPQRRAYAEPMARLLIDAGELARAAEILERAAPAGGGEPSYHALQGAVAQRLDRHEQAINAYTRALEGNSARGRWWLGLGISLAAAGHPSEARSAFREARATGDLSERLDRWAQQRMEALASSAGD